MLVLLQPQERARRPHPHHGKQNCNVPITLPSLMDDKWKNVRSKVGTCSKFLPAKREMHNIAGKIRNSRQAALTSGKQISVSCNVLQDSKHGEYIL